MRPNPKLNLKKKTFPVVAIIGRPNVGKSTLFNRLVGKRKSIVQKESGTTRDLIQEAVLWQGKKFILTDTGGLEFAPPDTLQAAVEVQVEQALTQSDLLIWTVDAAQGLTPLDLRLADKLRRIRTKILIAANKSDIQAHSSREADFYKLGVSEIFCISALHGRGIGELLDRVLELLPENELADIPEPDHLFTIAIAGEPNSGKSTYLNQIVGENRSIVASIPGTTRDSIDGLIDHHGERIRIIDTAGFRTRNKITEASMFFSLSRTKDAIRESDIVLLVFDAERGFTKTSKAIAEFIGESGKGVILVANKWDLVKMPEKDFAEDLRESLPFLNDWPMEFISAKFGQSIDQPIRRARILWNSFNRRIPTKELNESMKKFLAKKPPPPASKISFVLQTEVKPPSFIFFARHRKRIPEHYFLYLKNELSKRFDFGGVPIRMRIKESSDT